MVDRNCVLSGISESQVSPSWDPLPPVLCVSHKSLHVRAMQSWAFCCCQSAPAHWARAAAECCLTWIPWSPSRWGHPDSLVVYTWDPGRVKTNAQFYPEKHPSFRWSTTWWQLWLYGGLAASLAFFYVEILPQHLRMWPHLEIELLQVELVKMRSHWSTAGLNPIWLGLTRWRPQEETYAWECCGGLERHCHSLPPPEARRGARTGAFRGGAALPTPSFAPSGLQTETIMFYGLKHSNWGTLLQWPQETDNSHATSRCVWRGRNHFQPQVIRGVSIWGEPWKKRRMSVGIDGMWGEDTGHLGRCMSNRQNERPVNSSWLLTKQGKGHLNLSRRRGPRVAAEEMGHPM